MTSSIPASIGDSEIFEKVLGSRADESLIDGLTLCYRATFAAGQIALNWSDWGGTSGHEGQYVGDVAADNAALEVLHQAGVSIYSEESGSSYIEGDFLAVIDPVDGSTNASRGIPLWCSSVALVDQKGTMCSVVYAPAIGELFWAARGLGSYRWTTRLKVLPRPLAKSIIFLNGHVKKYLGWAQYRALGSAALELALVAAGAGDAFLDASWSGLAPWDYMGSELILKEAGGVVFYFDPKETPATSESFGDTLLTRRRVLAANSAELAGELISKLEGMGDTLRRITP
jgi:fructose-1,6-bisphosphatase/inositol monophosphatase family enzyme